MTRFAAGRSSRPSHVWAGPLVATLVIGIANVAEAQERDPDASTVPPIELEVAPPEPAAPGGPGRGDTPAGGATDETPPPRIAAGGRILGEARAKLRAEGCAAAAPAYRVAAGMGKDFEVAQYELGDCLLTMQGKNAADTAMFRQEGMLWLNRAAYAGNARAQYRLAILHASPVGGQHDPALALQWALAYRKNSQADLYGQGPLPSTMVDGLRRDLPPEAVADAETFAANFTALPLDGYEPALKDGKRDTSFGERQKEFERKRRERGGRGPGLAAGR